MRYTVYQVTNLINNKIYIGKHQTEDPNDSYFGSGKAIKQALKLHGILNFRKDILFDFDSENEMNLKEAELVTEEFVARHDTYNLGVGGEGGAHFKGRKHSQDTIDKFVGTRLRNEVKPSARQRQRVSETSKGKIISPEHRRKISEAQKGCIPWNKGKTLKAPKTIG